MSTLDIRHSTTFKYSRAIPSSYNEARLLPTHLPRQKVLTSRVDISPVTWQTSYTDYWGTRVTAFEVLRPHDELVVVARSRVEVLTEQEPRKEVTWDELTGPVLTDLLAEYLDNSEATTPADELADFALEAAGRADPDTAAREVCSLLFERIAYVPGSTNVHTPAIHAWESKSGVCQDFAHLAIGALRTIGIPARYVSGYLHPSRTAAIGETVPGESHAWVEWWAGGWRGFDPTNNSEVGDHHVVVARARQYKDVMPVSGVFAGADSELDVTVEVTQVA